jgi:RNA polymerase sigma factor (sigma-70 family)
MTTEVRTIVEGPPPEPAVVLTEAQAQTLIVETIQRNAESLLRTARRHSLCADDAQDAYQRAMEIFVRRARTLDPERAAGWLHTVTKHEAMEVRRQRQQLVAAEDVDFDRHEARHLPSPDERVVSFDQLTRSAEALQRLKPNELRALWLKASGQSYATIAEAQGWTYTKVNRLITEGRRAFLKRYAEIEAGRECERWAGVINALIDGEATAKMLSEARPHLRNCPACRAIVRELRKANTSLAIVLPVVTTATAMASGGRNHEPASGLAMRLYEAVTGGMHERVAASAVKIQAGLEVASAGKVAAVVASAAAVAGGGIAVIGHDLPVAQRGHRAHAAHSAASVPAHRHHALASSTASHVVSASLPTSTPTVHRPSVASTTAHVVHRHRPRHEFDRTAVHRATTRRAVRTEFPVARAPAPAATNASTPRVAAVVPPPTPRSPVPTSAGVAKGGEFGP